MDNDSSLQVTVPIRRSSIPEIHPAATVLTVRWGHEIGIVVTAAIVGVGNDAVVLLATSAKVVLLEIARWLIEPVTVVEIMNHVGGIEQLGDSGVDVLLSLLQRILLGGRLGIIRIMELKILSAVRSVIGKIGVPTLPIFMGEDVIAPGISVIADHITAGETLVG